MAALASALASVLADKPGVSSSLKEHGMPPAATIPEHFDSPHDFAAAIVAATPAMDAGSGKPVPPIDGGSGLLAFAPMRASRSLGERSAHEMFGGSGNNHNSNNNNSNNNNNNGNNNSNNNNSNNNNNNHNSNNNNSNNNNNHNNGYSAWKFLALAAAMAAAGAYYSAREEDDEYEYEYDKNERTSDNDWMLTRSNLRHRPSANGDTNANANTNANWNANADAEDLAAHLPVHRTTKHKPRRRDTAFRIQLGDSIVVDRIDFVDDVDDNNNDKSSSSSSSHTVAHETDIPLVLPEDEDSISPFLYCLMKQMTLVRIDEHNRELYHNKLPVGLPGIACAHCCCSSPSSSSSGQSQSPPRTRRRRRNQGSAFGRGRCQIFPMNRRTLPGKVRKQLYQHVRSCDHCPVEIKMELERLNRLESKAASGGGNNNNNDNNNDTNTNDNNRKRAIS
eukprot:CAMPEP_0172378542 /NCGR_PEP_ID=MMETSP1060-20121228/69474_1 /TAXON_ID=37318 /ORGANISM="Pseudo-nitzschia pungens, Strain cf. cingulata" /LENGTH=448 /DNA_ID=CAMNT_0013106263 /DNA_START=235 /DNA_END=1580 /DNA_ORIENTATION=-